MQPELTIRRSKSLKGDLANNLYKPLNRMSSGSYFPAAGEAGEHRGCRAGGTFVTIRNLTTSNVDCTGPQFGFGMGGDLSSVSPTLRPAL